MDEELLPIGQFARLGRLSVKQLRHYAELDDGTAVQRWTTVVTHPDELGWLREALQLLAGDDQEDQDGLEPL